MTLIAILFVLYMIGSILEGLEAVFASIHAVMSSPTGTIITIAVTAYLTYRWYRARHQAVRE